MLPAFSQAWAAAYPSFEPIPYKFKTAFPDRWVRFHMLPRSKRYPATPTEYRTVLNRHNAVLGRLARPGWAVVLLTTEYGTSRMPGEAIRESRPVGSSAASWWRTVSVDECFWHVYAEAVAWHRGRFDTLLRQVADDKVANVTICDPACRWAYHPYDGGADVILASTAERDRLRSEFAGWLSARSDGL